VSVPRGLDPLPFSCELGPGGHSAACLNTVNPRPPSVTLITAVGNCQPLPYLLPSAVLRAASSAPASLRLARAAEALTTLALLTIAVFALYDAGSAQLSLLGLLLAVTPMVLFCGASRAWLVLAVAVNRLWEGLYGSHVSLDTTKLHAGLVAGAHEWWRALPELVGKFGYLDVKLPLLIPLSWFALVLALSATAAAVSRQRWRLLLAVVLIVGLVGPIVLYAARGLVGVAYRHRACRRLPCRARRRQPQGG